MYLMDAGMILMFITLGKYLEARAKGRASAAIRKLLDLAPPMANVQRDGAMLSVPPDQVAVGETIVVRPGEKMPLDAQVLRGTLERRRVVADRRIDPVEKKVPAARFWPARSTARAR